MMWKGLESAPRLLMEATLQPLQGARFQPTGFPDLGPAEYTAPDGTEMLLVESAQSMANHMESVCWSEAMDDTVEVLRGLPYVRAKLPGGRMTNSILESHRLNSPYIVSGPRGVSVLPELAALEKDPGNVRQLARTVFKYDPNSVLHGVFLTKVAGGLRLRRILSAFVEARDVHAVDSGGIKVDRVDPTGKLGGGAEAGYGHVPFHRREFTAREIKAYFSLDLAQVRAYGLGGAAEALLIALALYKVQSFLQRGLRLRTACDLQSSRLEVTEPVGWTIPSLADIERTLPEAIRACAGSFTSPPITEVDWKPTKAKKPSESRKAEETETESEEEQP